MHTRIAFEDVLLVLCHQNVRRMRMGIIGSDDTLNCKTLKLLHRLISKWHDENGAAVEATTKKKFVVNGCSYVDTSNNNNNDVGRNSTSSNKKMYYFSFVSESNNATWALVAQCTHINFFMARFSRFDVCYHIKYTHSNWLLSCTRLCPYASWAWNIFHCSIVFCSFRWIHFNWFDGKFHCVFFVIEFIGKSVTPL